MTTLTAIPELETERLILRGFRQDDLDDLLVIESDPDVTRFTGGVQSRDRIWRFMAAMVGHWSLRGFGPFAIVGKDEEKVIGFCGPWYPVRWPEPEICWTFGKAHQGKGYATEAARRAITYVYETLNWETVMSPIDAKNFASQGVAKKLGATLEAQDLTFEDFTVDIWRHVPAREWHA
ncbi:MAG: GNAT family N-acetyltransferase [Pseudomonadota bacterium]